MFVGILLRGKQVPTATVGWMIFLEDFLHILVMPQDGFALVTFDEMRHRERGSLGCRDPEQRRRLVVFASKVIGPTIASVQLIDFS